MSKIAHSKIDEPTSLIRPRRRNRSIQAPMDKLSSLHTIDYNFKSPNFDKQDHQPHDIFTCPRISLPPSVMAELQKTLSKHPVQTIQIDRRLYNKEKNRAKELESWSIEGKLWRKPSSKVTVDQIVNHLDEKRKGSKKARDLSLDLYSRMINSFKNNYKSARKTFQKQKKEQASLKSLSKFERKYLPSKLMSNYVPFSLTSPRNVSSIEYTSQKGHKQSSSSIAKTKAIKPTTLVLIPNQDSNKSNNNIQALSPKGSTQLNLRFTNKNDRPWRTNAKFPQITPQQPFPSRRNFTPWRKISETDEDITHFI